jgi:peptidyl-dipeptidase Dcp
MKNWMFMMAFTVVIAACTNEKNAMKEKNPFYESYDAPYGAPPFDKIENKHYLPAFKEGIARHNREIELMASNSATPDFSNTMRSTGMRNCLPGFKRYLSKRTN